VHITMRLDGHSGRLALRSGYSDTSKQFGAYQQTHVEARQDTHNKDGQMAQHGCQQ
jgi:hypothetical protein